MTLADLPVLNPSTPQREAKRAGVVAALFLVFGVLYALARAAAAAPPDLSASTDVVFGFAYPAGWGIAPALWSGSATWPSRLAAADMGTSLAVAATVVMVIALVIVMHPDILSAQGPQYVSPARRITTVAIAFVLSFLLLRAVITIDGIFTTDVLTGTPDRARRELVGLGALSALLCGGIWSFIGPKDFGRRIPLRISHGALGGLAVWAAIAFATLLSSQPRSFLSSSLDTFYTLLTLDAARGDQGATAGWAVSSDILAAGIAMAVAGALLVVTAPQSLGPGNRRGSALVAAILGAVLAVVALTTAGTTRSRAAEVRVSVVEALGLDRSAPARTPIILAGQGVSAARRLVPRTQTVPLATADDCVHATGENRVLPAATATNVQRLSAWLDAHRGEVSGLAIRVASCRAALQALRWDPEAAREGVFLSDRPERTGPLTYLYAMTGLGSQRPAALSRILAALADTSRFRHGGEAATLFANYARIAGDTAAEAAWRQRAIQPADAAALTTLRPRPAYTDGSLSGRIASSRSGWRVALLIAEDPSTGLDPTQLVPRTEGVVLAGMVAGTDVGPDGRFAFTGLRDGFYMLALLSPADATVAELANLDVRSDPGVFRLDPTRRAKDLGTIVVDY